VLKTLKPYAPAIVWGIFIFILSVIPANEIPKIPKWIDILAFDKIVHMIFYGILTWLLLKVYPLSWRAVSLIFASSSGFGWFIEWYQGAYTTGRQFDFLDGVANSIGALCVALFFLFFKNRKATD
jgi:glycopeptide antibiotics resistance protein